MLSILQALVCVHINVKKFKLFFICSTFLLIGVSKAQVMEEGVIQGARYLVALPEDWNGKLLLIAHGYVPPNQPLSADFSIEKEIYQRLHEDGWMIASTSYPRNGIIIKDAIKDLDQLHQYLSKKYGKPKLSLLQGSSMGGLIATLVAESPKKRYQGVLSMGAALTLESAEEPFKLNYRPKVPILFLANQTEYQAPETYANSARGTVALWLIGRDGHVNVNHMEQYQAIRALEKLVGGQAITMRKNATIKMNPSSRAEFRKEGAFSRVQWMDPIFGNLFTELVPEDLQRLKVNRGQKFRISYGGKNYSVLYGSDYNDVPVGEWVAFLSGEGTFQISCNYCNAAKMLSYRKGDRIFIQK